MTATGTGGESPAIATLLGDLHEKPKIVRVKRTGIEIPKDDSIEEALRSFEDPFWKDSTEQRTLRGRIVGLPVLTWKHYRNRSTTFTPWPAEGSTPHLVVRLATHRHGVLTLPLPRSSMRELVRLESELAARGLTINDRDVRVSMVDRGGYFFATFAEVRP